MHPEDAPYMDDEELLALEDEESLEEDLSMDPYEEEASDERYWALGDPEQVVEDLCDRRHRHQHHLERHPVFQKIVRSLFYSYGFLDGASDTGGTAITIQGEHGQVLEFHLDYYRHALKQLVTLYTAELPRYKAVPRNDDTRARIQSRIAKRVLEWYEVAESLPKFYREILSDALTEGMAFALVSWNPNKGEPIDVDPNTGREIMGGDVDVELLDFLDVVWPFQDNADWDRDVDWVWVRRRRNKWDLAELYPESRRQILEAASASEESEGYDDAEVEDRREDDDKIYVWEFYHRKTPAVPEGRHILALEDGTWFLDMPNPYRRLPVHPLIIDRAPNDLLGWSPLWNIQQPFELLAEEFAKIATIHDNLGLPLVWAGMGFKQPDPDMWIGNIAFVESEQKPEVVNLAEVPEGVFTTIELLVSQMDRILGLNDPVQGQAAGSVRANRMQIFAEAQTRRYNSPIEAQFYNFFERVGTAILEILQDFPSEKRTLSIVGKRSGSVYLSFSPEEIYDVVGVKVEVGSELTRTIQGRLEVADVLGRAGLSLPKEEYLAILDGSPLSVLTEGVQAELDRVNAENEGLMSGAPHHALITDNHVLDIKKHVGLLSNPVVRSDPEAVNRVLAAVMEHFDWLAKSQPLQQILGYMGALPAPAGAPPEEESGGEDAPQNEEAST